MSDDGPGGTLVVLRNHCELRAAAKGETLRACAYYSRYTYTTMLSTLELIRTLWGSKSVIDILEEAIQNNEYCEDAQIELVSASCCVLADEEACKHAVRRSPTDFEAEEDLDIRQAG